MAGTNTTTTTGIGETAKGGGATGRRPVVGAARPRENGRHPNARFDDATWVALFRRWHAGEKAAALRAEAGVSADTWTSNAKRLGMRRRDLPDWHPGRWMNPPYAHRPDGYRHHNSRLTEGEWRTVFRLWALGVPAGVLGAHFGVHATTVVCNARARGLNLPAERPTLEPDEIAALLAEAPRPDAALAAGTVTAGGVRIDPADPEGTRAAFDAVIAAAGAGASYTRLRELCESKKSVEQAVLAPAEKARAAAAKAAAAGAAGAGSPVAPSSPGVAEGLPPPAGEELTLRAAQRPPEGDWATWLFLGGRGAGKTLAGAMWLADMAGTVGPGGRLALIGPTLHDVREVMIDGASGLRSLPRWGTGARPVFESSRRRLVFPNGAMAYAFSAEDPDSLRGPQFSAAWADEFCVWRNGGEVLALLRMGLRLPLRPLHPPSPAAPEGPPPPAGEEPEGGAQAASARGASGSAPRLCVTTTPRPTAALRGLRAEASCVETHAGTRENAAHLSPGFLAGLEALYGGTRRAAQELEGRVVELDGALFTAEMLAAARRPHGSSSPKGGSPWDRVVVAVDPSVTAGGDACGIVAAGRCGDRAVVLADRSARGLSPEGWARRALRTAEEFGARTIVAEVNQGGDLVRAVLAAAGSRVKLRAVRATRGKRVRAEPVAALYEQGRVTHAGTFGPLEEELMAMGGPDEAAESLDRADALVWAITDLLIDRVNAGAGPQARLLDWRPPPSGISGRAW